MSESADINDPIQDPVCGKTVDPLRARAVGIYGGVTQYFCSTECKEKYSDPRSPEAKVSPPDGVERRWADEPREGTGEWFAKGAAAPPVTGKVERFDDLEAPRTKPKGEYTPTPSLLMELESAKKKPAWPWVVMVLALGGAALWFFGIRG